MLVPLGYFPFCWPNQRCFRYLPIVIAAESTAKILFISNFPAATHQLSNSKFASRRRHFVKTSETDIFSFLELHVQSFRCLLLTLAALFDFVSIVASQAHTQTLCISPNSRSYRSYGCSEVSSLARLATRVDVRAYVFSSLGDLGERSQCLLDGKNRRCRTSELRYDQSIRPKLALLCLEHERPKSQCIMLSSLVFWWDWDEGREWEEMRVWEALIEL